MSYSQRMQIGNVVAVASSGLRFQAQRLAQSAANVANVNTDGFESQRVIGESQAAGGVVGHIAPTYTRHAVQVADDGSTHSLSNTDVAQETVTQLGSLRAFQANLAVLRTSDEMLGELVNSRA
jgi:flagellar basal-body rod protein FlgC